MKHILFILFALIGYTGGVRAQCVIYTCSNTGAWGTGYNEAKVVTMAECDESALSSCKTNGGTNCKLSSKSMKSGWWAVIAIRRPNSPAAFYIAEAKPTQAAAEAEAKRMYKAQGGVNENVKIKSWRVFPKSK